MSTSLTDAQTAEVARLERLARYADRRVAAAIEAGQAGLDLFDEPAQAGLFAELGE